MFLGGKLHVEFLLMYKANSYDRELKKTKRKEIHWFRSLIILNERLCTNKEWLDSALSKGTMFSCILQSVIFVLSALTSIFSIFQGETCSTVPWNTAVYRGPTIRYDKNTEKKNYFFFMNVSISCDIFKCLLCIFCFPKHHHCWEN